MNEREKLLFLYTGALERGDMETVAAILRHAADDVELGVMIEEINAAYIDEPLTTSFSNNGNYHMTTITIPRKRANTSGLTLMVAAVATLILFSLMIFLPVSYNGVTPPSVKPQLDQRITPGNADRLNQFAVVGGGMAYDVALSPDGQNLAVATARGILIYNASDGAYQPFGATDTRIFDIEYNPDGSILAGVIEHDLILWDAQTGDVLNRFDEAYLPDFTFSPDGQKILIAALGCENGASPVIAGCQQQYQMVLLDVESGETVKITPDGLQRVMLPTFSLDGSLIAFAQDSNVEDNFTQVVVWKMEDIGQENAAPLMGFRNTFLLDLAISPDNRYIAAAGNDISLWSLETKKLAYNIGSWQINSVDFSADSQFVIFLDKARKEGAYQSVLRSWDIENERLGFPIMLKEEVIALVNHFELSANQKTLMTRNSEEIALWNIEDPAAPSPLLSLNDYSDNRRQLVFKGDNLLSSGWYNIQLWDMDSLEKKADIPLSGGPTFGVINAISSDDTVAYFDGYPTRRLMYWKNGESQATNLTFNDVVTTIYDEQDNLLVYHIENRKFMITRVKEGRVMDETELQVPFDVFSTVVYRSGSADSVFSPDGRLLVTGLCYLEDVSCDKVGLLLFDTESGDLLGTIETHGGLSYFAPIVTIGHHEGRYLLAGGACVDEQSSPCITAWDITPMLEGEPAKQLFSRWSSDYADIINFRFSPDLTMLALAGGNKHKVMLWDTENGAVIKELTDLFFPTDVAFNDDMTRLAVIAEGLIYLWDVE